LIVTPDAALWGIRYRAERAVDDVADALRNPLTTLDEDIDSSEAREQLTGAAQAAKALVSHLDAHFDFYDGFAWQKEEEPCQG
jgi:hypothetical protein